MTCTNRNWTIAFLSNLAVAFAAVSSLGVAPLAAQKATVKTTAFSGDLGFVSTSGNTSVTSLNVGDKFTANTVDKHFIFTQTAAAVYGKVDGEKTVENYRFQLRGDYKLGGKLYLFGVTGWDRNTFGGISRRFEETIGLAYQAVTLPKDELQLEAGLSLFQQRNTFAPPNTSLDDNYKAGRAAAEYKHSFNTSSFFTQALEFLPNFDVGEQWRLNSETALIAPISRHLALKAGYVIRYDNLPPFTSATSTARLKKSDRFLTMGITVSY
ncbi:MAG: DUF481 domain-containing protein [Gemmatimonadota bacterium]